MATAVFSACSAISMVVASASKISATSGFRSSALQSVGKPSPPSPGRRSVRVLSSEDPFIKGWSCSSCWEGMDKHAVRVKSKSISASNLAQGAYDSAARVCVGCLSIAALSAQGGNRTTTKKSCWRGKKYGEIAFFLHRFFFPF